MKPKWIALIVLAVLTLIFLFQNMQVVTLNLFFWHVSMPQIIFIPLVLLVGFGSGYACARLRHGKKAGNSQSSFE